MKIIINGKHVNKLSVALEEVQARCKVRILNVNDIEEIISNVTSKLNIPKNALIGTKILYSGAEIFPSSYRYRPESTHFTAEFNGRNWVIIGISRGTCPDRYSNVTIMLSDSAKQAIVNKFNYIHI